VTLYRLSQLTKTYRNRRVLDIPFLEIEGGRIYALMGPNGAGKTTLLNILGFLDAPGSGSVHFRSHPVQFTEPTLQALRKEVVMVDQHPILFTTTVFKNLEFGLKVRKIAKNERERMIAESLEMVGMLDFAQAPAHRLSGGETQRVALARAFAVAPKVLLCDEPTANVDEENQTIILQILRQINELKGISILFTTHDRAQALSLARHTLILNRGSIVPEANQNNKN